MIQVWVGRLIYIQCVFVALIVVYTFMLLLVRKMVNVKRQKRIDDYSLTLAEEMSEIGSDTFSVYKEERDLPSRPVMKEVLLGQMKLTRGDERDFLIRLYRNHQFIDEDLKQTHSLSPAKRLSAITNLGTFNLNELAPVFYKRLDDSDPLVAVVAALSLSVLTHPLNSPDLFLKLPQALKNELEVRSNALNEFIANLGVRHGLLPLEWILTHDKNPIFVRACIRAIRHLQTADSCPLLNNILVSQPYLPGKMLSEIIQAVRTIGDPSSIAAVRPYLNHADPEVRAESAAFLLVLEDEESFPKIEKLKKEHTVQMERMLKRMGFQGARKA